MAKSQRSKREKQKDFVKKKVKVGKTLQKPQNETITTFKTRSILILEQLAEKEAGSNVTKKRYTLSELCSRLGQKNPNQKLDACQGIKELFGKLSSEQTRLGLSSLMPALCPCLLDDDSKVRTTTIQLFELLIDKVGCSSMRSHFTLLGRHASCGLVSLHSDVQASALQLLHVLLRKTPQLLPLHAPTILPNLLRLLGAKTKSGVSLQKVFTEGIGGNLSVPNPLKKLNNSANDKKDKKDKKEKASKGEEDMVVMPGEMSSKHNSLLWQLDVLVLVSGLLQQLLQHHTSRSVHSRPMGRWQMLLESCRTCTSGAGGGMGALGDGVAHTSSTSLLCHPTRLRTVCLTVMTMVHSLWCSFVPHTTSRQSGYGLSNASAHCLWCLVQLHHSLASLVLLTTAQPAHTVAWFHDLTVEVFGALLSCHFPFHYADLAPGSKTKNKCTYEARPQLSCDDLNINVATVAVQFRLFDARHSHSLVQYIQELVTSEGKVGCYRMESLCWLIQSLVYLFACNEEELEHNHNIEVIEQLLDAALVCYKAQHPLKKEKKQLLQLLLTLTDADHRHLRRLCSVQRWCEVLVAEVVHHTPVLPGSLLTALHGLLLTGCPGAAIPAHLKSLACENILREGRDWSERDKLVLVKLISR